MKTALSTYRLCPFCECLDTTVRLRRQNTRYVDDSLNWVDCCSRCYDNVEAYWADMWWEYYRGRL